MNARRASVPNPQPRTLDPEGRTYQPLQRKFFARGTLQVARDLLGQLLVHATPKGRLVGRIVEVEAYRGPRDPASHAHRMTPRSKIMWGMPGTAYVYFTYGNHACVNVVTEPEGTAGAVLLRALEPVEGLEQMRHNRGLDHIRLLASGPGRLTQAMGIRPQHNGTDLTQGSLYIARGGNGSVHVRRSPRIGIRVATERPWRFYIAGNPCVSR